MILRKFHYSFIGLVILIQLCKSEDPKAEYDANDWIPISQPCTTCNENDKVEEKKATGRVLNLAEPPQSNFFPDENKQPRNFQQFLRETTSFTNQRPRGNPPQPSAHPYRFENLPPQVQQARPSRPQTQKLTSAQQFYLQDQPKQEFAATSGQFSTNSGQFGANAGQFAANSAQFPQNAPYFPQEYHTIPQEYLTQQGLIRPNNLQFYQPDYQTIPNIPDLPPIRLNASLDSIKSLNKEVVGKQSTKIDITSTTPRVEKENVQLLYVPLESLNQKYEKSRLHAYQQVPTGDVQFNNYRPLTTKQQQIHDIQSDFARQALEAHKLQLQLQQDQQPYALPIINTTPPPTTTTTTTKKPTNKKRKPHQPPLAVYMGGNQNADIVDVLTILKDAKTIDVQDSVGPDSPKIFVGPSNLDAPQNYAKFELPYLSSLDNNRVERKVEQLPFFVAPLSYKAPPGYSKIPLPSPHVGSVVVNNKRKLQDVSKPVQQNLPDAYQQFTNLKNQQYEQYTARPVSSTIRYSKPIPEDQVVNQFELDQINGFVPQFPQPIQQAPEKYSFDSFNQQNTYNQIRTSPSPQAADSLESTRFYTASFQSARPTQEQYLHQVQPTEAPVRYHQEEYVNAPSGQDNESQKVNQQKLLNAQEQYAQEVAPEKHNPDTIQQTRNTHSRPRPTTPAPEQYHQEITTRQQVRSRTRPTTTATPAQYEYTRDSYRPATHVRSRPTITPEPQEQFLKETVVETRPTHSRARPTTTQTPKQQFVHEDDVEDKYFYEYTSARSTTPKYASISEENLYAPKPTQNTYADTKQTKYTVLEEFEAQNPITKNEQIYKGVQEDDEDKKGEDAKYLIREEPIRQQPINRQPINEQESRQQPINGRQPVYDSTVKPVTVQNQHVLNQEILDSKVLSHHELIEQHQQRVREHQKLQAQHLQEQQEKQKQEREHQQQEREHQQQEQEYQAKEREHQAKEREHQLEEREHQLQEREHQQREQHQQQRDQQQLHDIVNYITGPQQIYTPSNINEGDIATKIEYVPSAEGYEDGIKTQNANVQNYNFPSNMVLPSLINNLEDQSVRQLLHPGLVPTSTIAPNGEIRHSIAANDDRHTNDDVHHLITPNGEIRQVSSTHAPPTTTTTSTPAPTSNYASTHLPVVETTTRKIGRGRQRGNRYTTTTQSSVAPKRTVARGRRPLPTRTRYQDSEDSTTEHISARSTTDPTKRIVTARSRFRTRGRPAQTESAVNERVATTERHYFEENQSSHIPTARNIDSTPRLQQLDNYRQPYDDNLGERITPKVINVEISAPATEPVIIHQINQLPIRNLDDDHARTRPRNRVRVSTTPQPQTSRKYETDEKSESEEFYGFFREPNFSKPTEPPTLPPSRPVYSSTYISSTLKYPEDSIIQLNGVRYQAVENPSTPVHFIGEIRPKYQPSSTAQYFEVTQANPSTERHYDEESKPRPRGRIRVPARRITAAESVNAPRTSNELNSREESSSRPTQRIRTRGKTHFKVPSKPKTTSAEDEDVEGGNYPPQFKAATSKPSFQITVEPHLEDQEPYSSIYRPTYLAKEANNKEQAQWLTSYQNQNYIADGSKSIDEPTALPVVSSKEVNETKSTIMQEIEKFIEQVEEEDAFTTTQLPEIVTKKRRGVWKLVKRPVDVFESAESQNIGNVKANLFMEDEKDINEKKINGKNKEKYSLEINKSEENEVSTISETSEETTTPITTSTEGSFFNSLYEMFGISNKAQNTNEDQSVEATTENNAEEETTQPIEETTYFTTSSSNSLETDDITENPFQEFLDEKPHEFPEGKRQESIENKPQKFSKDKPQNFSKGKPQEVSDENPQTFLEEKVTTTTKPPMTYITPMTLETWNLGILKTSTSTEISHETEICYKGRCIKSKDMKVPMT